MADISERTKSSPKASMQILLFVIFFGLIFVLESH
jgi:hypothetical protein